MRTFPGRLQLAFTSPQGNHPVCLPKDRDKAQRVTSKDYHAASYFDWIEIGFSAIIPVPFLSLGGKKKGLFRGGEQV
jgi:hypothetical protein